MEHAAGACHVLIAGEDDDELVRLAKTGDPEATRRLLSKYHHFVRVKANSYFLAGGDGDDLIQEGYIGLYKAIRDYELRSAAPASAASPSSA